MKKNIFNLIAFAAFILFLAACEKNDSLTPALEPQTALSVSEDTVFLEVNDSFTLSIVVKEGENIEHQWFIEDTLVSEDTAFQFIAKRSGIFHLTVQNSNQMGIDSQSLVFNVAIKERPSTENSSPFISEVFEYSPAPGQLINSSLGDTAAAHKLVGGKNGLVSLGAYGGYVVFGFDHSIINQEGADIAIYGNPNKFWSEPGIVMVSQDENGNGIPDDTWYELAGSEEGKEGTIYSYKITYYNPHEAGVDISWKDNQGNTGYVEANNFHKQPYYPENASNPDSITFEGTLLKNTFIHDGIYKNGAFDWGYTDSYSEGDDYATNKYNALDIDNAVDKDRNPVELSSIDFIKVYTGQNHKGNTMMGEISTEISGAADIHLIP